MSSIKRKIATYSLCLLLIPGIIVIFNKDSNEDYRFQFDGHKKVKFEDEYEEICAQKEQMKFDHVIAEPNLKTSKDERNVRKIRSAVCGCVRNIEVNNKSADISYDSTSCGRDAFARGPGQKIISYTFYGDLADPHVETKGFFEGIAGNAESVRAYFPGWNMRLYVEKSNNATQAKLCQLVCEHHHLDLCPVKNLPGHPVKDVSKLHPMIWRWMPVFDEQVDYFMSRDLDSRQSCRELSAVNEWLESGLPFHLMRDHPEHTATIMGAMWAVNLTAGKVREMWALIWKRIVKMYKSYSPRTEYGDDQYVLNRVLWTWAKSPERSMQHDSYHCRTYKNTRPFPTKRRKGVSNNFVGSVVFENMYINNTCPVACRPKLHRDWAEC